MKFPTTFPWLESLIVLTGIALVVQIFPSLWTESFSAGSSMFWRSVAVLDVRNWSWGVWVAVEAAVVFLLVGLRVWQTR